MMRAAWCSACWRRTAMGVTGTTWRINCKLTAPGLATVHKENRGSRSQFAMAIEMGILIEVIIDSIFYAVEKPFLTIQRVWFADGTPLQASKGHSAGLSMFLPAQFLDGAAHYCTISWIEYIFI